MAKVKTIASIILYIQGDLDKTKAKQKTKKLKDDIDAAIDNATVDGKVTGVVMANIEEEDA